MKALPEYQGWADSEWMHSVGFGPLDIEEAGVERQAHSVSLPNGAPPASQKNLAEPHNETVNEGAEAVSCVHRYRLDELSVNYLTRGVCKLCGFVRWHDPEKVWNESSGRYAARLERRTRWAGKEPRAPRQVKDSKPWSHGTVYGYRQGCKCQPCSGAASAQRKARRERKKGAA